MISYQNSYISNKIIIPKTYIILQKFILLENLKKAN
jgi:hypothetical protein